MKSWLTVASIFIMVLTPSVSYSGEIEIGGKWYTFEEILPEKNVEVQERESGLTGYQGISDELFDSPARILVILGYEWSKCFSDSQLTELERLRVENMARCMPNSHLAKRFWPLRDPVLIIREMDASFYYVMVQILHPAVKRESGWYKFGLALLFTQDQDKALKTFKVLSDIAEEENNTFGTLSCVEMRGRITWYGSYNKENPGKSKYTYSFRVDSINVVGSIPNGYSGVPAPSLEEATTRCSPNGNN